jgi:site-specific recombinase XerD
MRVIQTADVVSGDEALLESFQQNLTRQDLSGATCRHYLHDLKLFRDWLIWLHEGKKVSLTEVNPADLAAFRKHLIQEKGHKPSTVNRRVQSLRLFYRWLLQQGHTGLWQNESLSTSRRQKGKQPSELALREQEVKLALKPEL